MRPSGPGAAERPRRVHRTAERKSAATPPHSHYRRHGVHWSLSGAVRARSGTHGDAIQSWQDEPEALPNGREAHRRSERRSQVARRPSVGRGHRQFGADGSALGHADRRPAQEQRAAVRLRVDAIRLLRSEPRTDDVGGAGLYRGDSKLGSQPANAIRPGQGALGEGGAEVFPRADDDR